MSSKKCNRCGLSLTIDSFYFRSDTKKYKNTCKSCDKNRIKKWRTENKDLVKKYSKKWRDNNKQYMIDYYNNHINDIKKYKRSMYVSNKAAISKKNKQYREENKDLIKSRKKVYYKKNKDSINSKMLEYRKNNISARIKHSLRNRIRLALKNNQKCGSAVCDLGCSVGFLKIYLESKFYYSTDTKTNMTWENYGRGGWHIDHIIPLSWFDLSNRSQFLEACHYTNLQPLWERDNIIKGGVKK